MQDIKTVQDIKANHQELANKFLDIGTRLSSVEAKADIIDSLEQQIKANSDDVNVIFQQYNELSSRMDDLEDRARRNNLIFYGISD